MLEVLTLLLFLAETVPLGHPSDVSPKFIVMSFLVLMFFCLSSSLIHFKNYPDYLTMGIAEIFILCMWFLPWSLIPSCLESFSFIFLFFLQRKTESPVIAAQKNAIRTNHIKTRIDKTQQNSKCRRLCGDRDETINHIISECSKLAQKE